MKQAETPFQFVAAASLILIGKDSPDTLAGLARGLKTVSDASIFCHTFQCLATHHYTSYSNDFAQWAMAACNQAELAERFASVDVRQFVAIAGLRESLVATLDTYLKARPAVGEHMAFEPFYFCESHEVTLPAETRASNLKELAEGIAHIGLESLHYHFINSRLRLHLQTNDFSNWIQHELGMSDLAARVNRVDFYTNTLDGVREEIIACLKPSIKP
ncbi:MAG: DUF5752 family protein [Candidatus Acidiferrales bacterium]